jgi:surfactin synthase thioesterase subunit
VKPWAGQWFQPATASIAAPVRLFLFPCAGAGASMYHEWLTQLPADVAVQCVQLPGREDRGLEAVIPSLEPLVDLLLEALSDESDGRPYAFFGHSMGALVAYRLAVALAREGSQRPALLAVAGWAPEGFQMPTAGQTAWTDAEVVEWMLALGALPPRLVDDPEMLGLALPAIRADLALCAGYVDDGAGVGSPVVAYSGAADRLIAPAAMACWSGRSPTYLGNRTFPGGHFFLRQHALAITTDLTPVLRRYAAYRGYA